MKRMLMLLIFLTVTSVIVIGCIENDDTYLPDTWGIPPIMSGFTVTDTVTNLSYTGNSFTLIQDRQYKTTVTITDADSNTSARVKIAVRWEILNDLPEGNPQKGASEYWLYDDGFAGDETAGDNVYTGLWVRSYEVSDFTEDVGMYISDNGGNISNVLTVRFNFNRYVGEVPPSPAGLAASGVGTTGFTLSWGTVVNQVTNYKVYKDDDYYTTTGAGTTTAAVTGLTPGTTYTMRVSAVNNYGEGIKSNGLDVTTSTDLEGHTIIKSVTVGTYPAGMAIEPHDDYLYVANWGEKTVSIIGRTDHKLIKTITTGSGPYGVAADPGRDYVYVTNSAINDGTVAVIQISDHSLLTNIDVGSRPRGVAVEPSGTYAYVARMSADKVSIISLNTNTILGEINVGDGPDGVTAVPGSTYVYVANSYTNTVSVINSATNTVIDTITVGEGPRGIAADYSGTYVIVSNWYDDTASIIQVATNTVVATLDVGNGPLAAAASDEYAYIANYFDETISVINLADLTVIKTLSFISHGSGSGDFSPQALVVDSDFSNLYITNYNQASVTVMKIDP